MFALIVFLVIALSITVYFLINDSIQSFDDIRVSYRKEMLMQSILMSYNKANAVFRDVKNGLYERLNEDWQNDVVTSLINIKKKRMVDLDLFSSQDLQAQFNNIKYEEKSLIKNKDASKKGQKMVNIILFIEEI